MMPLSMNESFSKFFQDKIIFFGFTSTIFFIFITFTIFLLFLRVLPPYLPIYNQMPWGEQRLGTKIEIAVPIIIVLVLGLSNLFFSKSIYEKMPLVARILAITSLSISFLALFFVVRTILLLL